MDHVDTHVVFPDWIVTVGTIDSTAQIFLQVTGAFSAASANNSLTERQLFDEVLN